MAGMNRMMTHGTCVMRPSSARSLNSAAALLLAASARISVRRMAMYLGDGDVRQH
jgi:hypothetical protein